LQILHIYYEYRLEIYLKNKDVLSTAFSDAKKYAQLLIDMSENVINIPSIYNHEHTGY